MAGEQTARRIEEPEETVDETTPEGMPHAGRALDVTAVHVPLASGGWMLPLVGVVILVSLTVLLLA